MRCRKRAALATDSVAIMKLRALRLQAGPAALRHVQAHGLKPDHVRVIPAAAGGPKGLILSPLDQWLFGEWLRQGQYGVQLIGASIGAWRMATACLPDPRAGFAQLAHDYIHQHYELDPGQKRPTAWQVSAVFGDTLRAFFEPPLAPILQHPRYRLHVLTSRGRRLL